ASTLLHDRKCASLARTVVYRSRTASACPPPTMMKSCDRASRGSGYFQGATNCFPSPKYSGEKHTFRWYFSPSMSEVPGGTVDLMQMVFAPHHAIVSSTALKSHDPSSVIGVGTQTNAISHSEICSRLAPPGRILS